MKNHKNVVAGLGEIGKPILTLLQKSQVVIGYDINPKLMNKQKFEKYSALPTSFLHVCIPFSKNFKSNVISLYHKFLPKTIVIHSTVSPKTTSLIQTKLPIPVIYSATRGVHKRMIHDLKKYTKYYAIEKSAPNQKNASIEYAKLLKKCNVKSKKMSNPITLELAKIVVDTTYYGWLINYAQLSNMIAKKHGVDYDEMWEFSDEIHKFLGNRPKMFPGFIGGHCVIPNLSLIDEESFWQIDKINNLYTKKVKNAKSIAKKYVKGKRSYDSK
ncbi:GDP-mannose dehydrogenase [Nitrosopumilus sp. K4]|uniref:GDP-mannose dehydrogenase n=1 Tax=Nitrosopumilus sp. K4 TaxID=2795383 RepID=UPI001BA489BB|nr:GDP-mannose dehydrogenase [Nitrosopumilus sp. K4]QUC64449.1 GDP-mannose dehydrogenase [Nitrosopumilus sp. K4]